LEPLEHEETRGYIQRRLELAGAPQPEILFPSETVARVYRHSRGIPRLVNTICENALINAYARQTHTITSDVIDEVATDLRLNVVHTRAGVENNTDLWEAAKTLLQLHEQLQGSKSRERDPRLTVVPGKGKHEPYI
jgi:hypothetical protein